MEAIHQDCLCPACGAYQYPESYSSWRWRWRWRWCGNCGTGWQLLWHWAGNPQLAGGLAVIERRR